MLDPSFLIYFSVSSAYSQILLDQLSNSFEDAKAAREASLQQRFFYSKINATTMEGKRIKAKTVTVFGGLRYQADSRLLRGWATDPEVTLAIIKHCNF